jgi:hypothetical protein
MAIAAHVIPSSWRTCTSSGARAIASRSCRSEPEPPLGREQWPRAVERVVSHLDRASAAPSSGAATSGRQLTESFYNIGSALRDWRFDPTAPALVRTTVTDAEWLLVELNEQVLQRRILPDLVARYFQGIDGLDYEVAVVSGGRPRRVVYASDPGFADEEVPDADGRMDVFGRATGESASTVRVFHRTSANRGPTAAVGVSWFPLLGDTTAAEDWQLVVRHRRGGPLGSFVAGMRQRGLAVSFAALFLLVLSLSMLLVTTIRAQRLARLQMDFVTAVSPELRHHDDHRIGGGHLERRCRHARTPTKSGMVIGHGWMAVGAGGADSHLRREPRRAAVYLLERLSLPTSSTRCWRAQRADSRGPVHRRA